MDSDTRASFDAITHDQMDWEAENQGELVPAEMIFEVEMDHNYHEIDSFLAFSGLESIEVLDVDEVEHHQETNTRVVEVHLAACVFSNCVGDDLAVKSELENKIDVVVLGKDVIEDHTHKKTTIVS